VAAAVAAPNPIVVAAELHPLADQRLARRGLARHPIVVVVGAAMRPIAAVAGVVAALRPIVVAAERHPLVDPRLARRGLARHPIVVVVVVAPRPIAAAAAVVVAPSPIAAAAAVVVAPRPIAAAEVLRPLAVQHSVRRPIAVAVDAPAHWSPTSTDRYDTTELHNSAFLRQEAIQALLRLGNLGPLRERHPEELVPTNSLKFDQKNLVEPELQASEALQVHPAYRAPQVC
jgi:hypothetical protein